MIKIAISDAAFAAIAQSRLCDSASRRAETQLAPVGHTEDCVRDESPHDDGHQHCRKSITVTAAPRAM
ncbi:MAG: hypothetical protein WBA40_06240 [Roseiarcus sp.]